MLKQYLVPKSIQVDDHNQYQVLDQLKQRYQNFKIKGVDYSWVWPTAMDVIGVAIPKDALKIINEIHKDHKGEPGNEKRYRENINLYDSLKNNPYVEIPVNIDLEENTPLPNGYDIDLLYTGEVISVIEELNEQIKEAYDDYQYDHPNETI